MAATAAEMQLTKSARAAKRGFPASEPYDTVSIARDLPKRHGLVGYRAHRTYSDGRRYGTTARYYPESWFSDCWEWQRQAERFRVITEIVLRDAEPYLDRLEELERDRRNAALEHPAELAPTLLVDGLPRDVAFVYPVQ